MKITIEQKKQGQEMYQKLVQKAWSDLNFKEKLLTEPLEAIKLFTGNSENFPENVAVVVEDQTDDSKIYLNIPKKLDLDNFELTDEELEIIAGGIIGVTLGTCAAIVTLIGFGVLLYDLSHR